MAPHFTVGIDAAAFYVPPIYLDLQTLAPARNLEYDKLSKGLGVLKMALPDVAEDAASMAANAVWNLMTTHNVAPEQIGRLYVGTESGVDGAKPLATYVLEMLNDRLNQPQGTDHQYFTRCDAVDLTFACIGGVDALQNTLDWVRAGANRTGIVVCTDYAKYEKGSGGEYTQGAGAVALLVTRNPRLLAIHEAWGVSTKSEHDFFKPGYRVTPVFDGQFSNACYQSRLADAYGDFWAQAQAAGLFPGQTTLSDALDQIVFHLPYAYHGKRMFTELFALERHQGPQREAFYQQLGLPVPAAAAPLAPETVRAVAKSPLYEAFVKQKIAAGQLASSHIGNMYTASVFMALLSCLETQHQQGTDLTGQQIGLCAYGSGSKSKVFAGQVQPGYRASLEKLNLFCSLEARRAITLAEYEALHDDQLAENLTEHGHDFRLARLADAPETLVGARYYAWG
jgi:hydroxymethylglutaryl-CoA synthase